MYLKIEHFLGKMLMLSPKIVIIIYSVLIVRNTKLIYLACQKFRIPEKYVYVHRPTYYRP
jgi:hypothetical protein